jgi:two-component system sensor histidine kinase YesM
VKDNGVGMDMKELFVKEKERVFVFSEIGVKNVDERIKLNFGDAYNLSIDTSPNGGTTVLVSLP